MQLEYFQLVDDSDHGVDTDEKENSEKDATFAFCAELGFSIWALWFDAFFVFLLVEAYVSPN